MDRAASDAAEILGDEISLDVHARRAASVDVDAETVALVERALDAQRDTLATFFSQPLVEREGAGFLRYGPGGFYGPHRDRGVVPSWPGAARRTIAVVVFLNDGFTGGTLRLLDESGPRAIVPQEGALVAFSADTLHEVVPVIDGTRDTVVDWFYRV
jgi:predicted 2-oxoglutarate/Fe(II)-dependent dioxygenase YbiX